MYEIVKEFNGLKVGDKMNFKDKNAKELIAEGYIIATKQLEKEVKVRTKELKLKKENDKDDSK